MTKPEDPDRVRMKRSGVIVFGKKPPILTGAQARVARGLLDWSHAKLASEAKVSVATLREIEADRAVPANALLRVLEAFERARVEFPSGAQPQLRA